MPFTDVLWMKTRSRFSPKEITPTIAFEATPGHLTGINGLLAQESEVSSVQVLAYNRADLALWFITCESTFALSWPIESVTKFNYDVSYLSPEITSLARDLLVNPGKTYSNNNPKTELINLSDESS
ncbi:uncharacterized protein TNCV_4070701 [Trichonephila clavipes]|nr:uncharacterized protein TNCV_4070701 [Trichonephila clavipes]